MGQVKISRLKKEVIQGQENKYNSKKSLTLMQCVLIGYEYPTVLWLTVKHIMGYNHFSEISQLQTPIKMEVKNASEQQPMKQQIHENKNSHFERIITHFASGCSSSQSSLPDTAYRLDSQTLATLQFWYIRFLPGWSWQKTSVQLNVACSSAQTT